MKDLKNGRITFMETIVRIEFGSHLYGTNTEQSDHDFKSVFIPDASDILLQRVKGSLGHKVKRVEFDKNTPEDCDDEAYSLQRYLSLLAEGQTVSIDMLFAPVPIITSPLWEEIKAHKDLLLTKKSAAFVRYCQTQANKYGIKGSRVNAVKKAMEFFKLGLNAGTTGKVGDLAVFMPELFDDHTKVIQQPVNPAGDIGTFFECCNRKVDFNNSLKNAYDIFNKIYENYGHRARLAQTNEGIDWKALSHAVRVAEEALELLNTGNVTFPLPNAKHILEIKKGEVPYEQVAEEIETLLPQVEEASIKSILRDTPDYEFIDYLVFREYKKKVLT